jgi:hypothetical protein
VFNRELDGQTLTFGNTSALYQSDLVMSDHPTGSYWFQVAGEAVVGTMAGSRLKPLALTTMQWGQWKGLHADTFLITGSQGGQETQLQRHVTAVGLAVVTKAVSTKASFHSR